MEMIHPLQGGLKSMIEKTKRTRINQYLLTMKKFTKRNS